MFEYIKQFLKMNDVEYKENEKLSKFSAIRIGGNARLIALPDSADKYVAILRFLGKSKIDYRVLGRMSNVLPSDDEYEGVIIKTDRLRKLLVIDNIAYVSAGITNASLGGELCHKGLSGFEELSGIPGSIGGAIYGNAGAFGREIADLISEVTFYSPADDLLYVATADELNFVYRSSAFAQGLGYIISAKILLSYADIDAVSKCMGDLKVLRQKSQPFDELSLGSTFKRPRPDLSAAKLIDQCGLKGYGIGSAQISKKHAGFIINIGDATADDYLRVAEYAGSCVYQKFGVRLEREVVLL